MSAYAKGCAEDLDSVEMITAKLSRDLEVVDWIDCQIGRSLKEKQIRQVVEIHLPRKETASPVCQRG